MTHSVIGIRETAWFKDILVAMRPYGVSAFPVLDSADRVVGVVSDADLLLKEIGPELTLNRGERMKAAGVTAASPDHLPAARGPGQHRRDLVTSRHASDYDQTCGPGAHLARGG